MKSLTVLVVLLLAACSPRQPVPAPDESPAAQDAGQAAASDPAGAPPASAVNARPIPAKLRAIGTEPFWSATIDGTTLIYKTPEFPAGSHITVTRRDGAGAAIFTGALDGKPLALTVEQGPCSDGMSDEIYPMTAKREIGPDTERGCAKAG